MSVEVVRKKAQDTIFTLGRTALHAIAPDDFELYSNTFELIDSQGVIEDIFHFPVMPSGISVGRQSLVNIKKTGTAYISQFNDSFVGRNVNISGTFGRKFRLLITKGIGGNVNNLAGDENIGAFDLNVKTGYGAVKLLERIIESSQKLDNYGNPKLLIFYNPTINHNHVIEVINFQLQQSLENNMMWNWNIEMKSIANVINNIFDNISLEGISNTIKDLT